MNILHIVLYLLMAEFTLGLLVGNFRDNIDRHKLGHRMITGLLAIIWPIVITGYLIIFTFAIGHVIGQLIKRESSDES